MVTGPGRGMHEVGVRGALGSEEEEDEEKDRW